MKQSKSHSKILWITETAMMLALLVALQGATAPLGNQFLTGSCVNLVLGVTSLLVGLWGGLTVAVISPFAAFLFNIGPKFVQLLPAIAVGNAVFVLLLHFLADPKGKDLGRQIAAWLLAAVGKFAALYLLMVKLLVPVLVSGGVIPQGASVVLGTQFSWPQLVTALIGGAVALLITPMLRRALKK